MSIRLYACGGTGLNIGKDFYKLETIPGFADIKTCFIDTSLSNIRSKDGKVIDESDVFLFEGLDGSGKLRASNFTTISQMTKQILQRFKPEDMNIVVSSGSGGSGGVISITLVKELLERNETVIVVMVGSEESKITIDNTIKSIQSLDGISRKAHKPVIVSYTHNSALASRQQNDTIMKQTITALSILCSKQNTELDTADVANFVDFEKVTSVKEGVTFLYVTNSEEDAIKIEHPISLASLFSEEGKTTSRLTPEYSCVGYTQENVLKGNDLHFITSQYDIKNVFAKLQHRLEEFNENSSARVMTSPLGGNVDNDGFVI